MPPPEPDQSPTAPLPVDNGVDMTQIEARLRLSPAERFRQGVIASRRMIEFHRRIRPTSHQDADRG